MTNTETFRTRLAAATTHDEVEAIAREISAAGLWTWGTYGLATIARDKQEQLAAKGKRWVDDPYRETTQQAGHDSLGRWA